MELVVDLGYKQIVNLISQLPANQIEKITKEFTQDYIQKKAQTEISEFQQFLLSGPIMSEEQYQNFKENRNHFDVWRIK
ncbi:hypothetical protein FACS189421_04780 [Bacteroidia bacterium]|nr:hypothetical protein FACS189421_04780 [Bacteroidia bacterium]GHT02926.1 hypothetical protein FACS189423_02650 [Bacteroidia bacterium]GHT45863.1 hypothetical protein FACS189440_02710 [Bacteroidia bacterium]